MAINSLNGGGPVLLQPVNDEKIAADLDKVTKDVDVGSGNLAGDVHRFLKDESLLPGRHHHKDHGFDRQAANLSMGGELRKVGQGSAGGVDETRLQKALAEIRDVSSSGIDLLARVMLEQQGMQRHEAVQDRTNMRAMARGALLQAAGELTKQADAMQAAAITQIVVTCVSAAVTVATTALSSGLKIGGAMREAGTFAKDAAEFGKVAAGTMRATSKLSTAGDLVGGMGQAFGKASEGGGAFAGTEGQIVVKQSEAAQKIDEANAQQYEGQADLKKGMQDAFDDNIKQIVQFVKELKDAVADIQSAITRHA